MSRMSSPDGSEIVTVEDQAGQAVLASLGWSRESGSRSEASSETGTGSGSQRSRSEQGTETSDEAPRRRGPGRPRKQHSEDTEGS